MRMHYLGVAVAAAIALGAPFSAARFVAVEGTGGEDFAPDRREFEVVPVEVESPCRARDRPGETDDTERGRGRVAYDDTLWIFDADFDDLLGDNAGWLAYDMSGTLASTNYWHKDTIRLTEPYLGDSTWWCGTYNECWRQPRGYGNDWVCILERDFPLSQWSDPGDSVRFEWAQRYAIERNYDYGYVDVSPDSGATWTTFGTYVNVGFIGGGRPVDWDEPGLGHPVLVMDAYAGQDVRLRFRFESDEAGSSQDSDDNPQHSMKDGAWQLDNFEWSVNDIAVWFDDCEAPGDNGWAHEDMPAVGQTGVVFERVFEPITHRPSSDLTSWWMAAVDSISWRMVDGQNSWLVSPAIDISGAEHLLGEWRAWVDCPRNSNDVYNLMLATGDNPECLLEPSGFTDEDPGWWYGGPYWSVWDDKWDAFTGSDWLRVLWVLMNDEPPVGGEQHWTGFMLDRMRVGVPTGSYATEWQRDTWNWFYDTFDVTEALGEIARLKVADGDGIARVFFMASNDVGETWRSEELARESLGSDWWIVPSPDDLIAPATEVWFYFESTDSVGVTRTYPCNAPAAHFEFSVLPIIGSTEDPAILLVDKHDRLTLGEERKHRHTSEYYYRETLEILGFEYDVYDVRVPSGSIHSYGPDTSGMKYYDTQIWFFNDFDTYTLWPRDQADLITWLSEAGDGKERNLLLTGNDFGKELMQTWRETLNFYTVWLGSQYIRNSVEGGAASDTLVGLEDASGAYDFMTHDDQRCMLAGGYCGSYFDVVEPNPAIAEAELVAEYERLSDHTFWPAGVAYTHPEIGYQTVNLGFGMEFMMHELLPNGYYATGIRDRVDLMANIMEYFGKAPAGTPTSAPENPAFVTRLGRAFPNPFNPVTTVEYATAEPGRVVVRVYNLAGRAVRTLVDSELEPGEYEAPWDGTTDEGLRAASGVYFIRMEAGGHWASEKLVLLK